MDGKPKRRWLRFSVRTLLVTVTIFCVWLGWNLSELRQRRSVRQYINANGGAVFNGEPKEPWNKLPLSWAMLGEEPVNYVGVPAEFSDEDRMRIMRWFPDAHIQRLR
jgi:hypothetical protein